MLAALGGSVWDLRARALLLTAYRTLCRSAELVALEAADMRASERGDGDAVVRRSKGDQEGRGSHRQVTARFLERLQCCFYFYQHTLV